MQPAKAHLSLVPGRPAKGHLAAIRSRLGKAAVLGGVAYVERVAYSDEFAAIFMDGLDAKTRKIAMATVTRIIAKAPKVAPARKPPSRNERVKVRWTDEMIARFKRLAPLYRSNVELADKLGLPACCEGAMKMGRSRYLRKASATVTTMPDRRRGQLHKSLPLAA